MVTEETFFEKLRLFQRKVFNLNTNPMKMMKGAAGAAKKSAKWGDDMREESMRQHKCFWGGGDQGTLSLRACDAPPPGGGKKAGGLVTRGSGKEKSRLNGSFKIR